MYFPHHIPDGEKAAFWDLGGVWVWGKVSEYDYDQLPEKVAFDDPFLTVSVGEWVCMLPADKLDHVCRQRPDGGWFS